MGHRLESGFKVSNDDNKLVEGTAGKQIAATGKGIIEKDRVEDMHYGENRYVNPDNEAGDPTYIEVDAFSNTQAQTMSLRSVNSSSGTDSSDSKKAEYVVTGYTVYYIDSETKQKVYLLYNTYDVENFTKDGKAMYCKANPDHLATVLNDKRFLKTGDTTTAWTAALRNADWFSSNMNTKNKLFLWLDGEHGLPDDVETVYVDWLYTRAERLSVTIKQYYTQETITKQTSAVTTPAEIDQRLSYDHKGNAARTELIATESEAVKKGSTWYSYETEEAGEDAREDEAAVPVLDANGNPAVKIPYAVKQGKSPKKCYLWRVEL